MKNKVLFILLILGAFAAKLAFESSFSVHSRMPASLKPVQAGYQAASLKKYAFGFESLIGAVLWVQLLQGARHDPVDSDAVSWEFAQLDAITELDPRLESAYEFGSVFLSALRRDKLGGKLLLEKWTKRSPNYWKARYLLGLHHYLQLRDKATAGPLILQAARMNGAPVWISSLGVRLFSETGELMQSLKLATELLPAIRDPLGRERLALRIRSLNYNLQKQVWTEVYRESAKERRRPADTNALIPRYREKMAELTATFADQRFDRHTLSLLQERFPFTWNPETQTVEATDSALEAQLGQYGTFDKPTENHNGK